MIKYLKKKWQNFLCEWSNPPLSFHHKPCRVLKSLSDSADLIQCRNCGRKFAINYEVQSVLPYERDVMKMYERHSKK